MAGRGICGACLPGWGSPCPSALNTALVIDALHFVGVISRFLNEWRHRLFHVKHMPAKIWTTPHADMISSLTRSTTEQYQRKPVAEAINNPMCRRESTGAGNQSAICHAHDSRTPQAHTAPCSSIAVSSELRPRTEPIGEYQWSQMQGLVWLLGTESRDRRIRGTAPRYASTANNRACHSIYRHLLGSS